MKALKNILYVVALALCLSGCGVSKYKDIKITSVDYKYFTPTSARSLEAVLLIGIDNPAGACTVSDVVGRLRYGDKTLVELNGGELHLEKKTSKVYAYPCSATLADGASLLTAIPLITRGDPEKLKADISLHVALKSGLGTNLVFDDIQLLKR